VRKFLIVAFAVLALFLLWRILRSVGQYVGAARSKHVALEAGNIPVPQERTISWRDQSALTEGILQHWASQELPDWQEEGKVKAPRVIIGKLALKRDLQEVNDYLLSQSPRGNSGSVWRLHPEGDYDFTLAGLTVILYLFGDEPETLFPQTQEHLLSTLLIEEGGKPKISVPRTLGLVRDTENHLLMTEGSRYLKNRWLELHGSTRPEHNNMENGLEDWLFSFLGELNEAGLYEFNSMPYLGYTMTALMNLEAFGSEAIRLAARKVLDRANWEYALGSLSLRRFAPFRRQLRKANITSLNSDYHTALMKVWMSLGEETSLDLTLAGGLHHALWACLLPYRLPDETANWVEGKPDAYFVRIGHGAKASPEIYSGDHDYLISAGGVHRGKRSMIVARPITLMLDDQAQELEDVFHLAGPRSEFTEWNNTGVHRDFACAAGPVHVPDGRTPAVKNALWAVYRCKEDISIAVHSRQDLGIVCLFRNSDAEEVLRHVSESNSDPELLYSEFQWPGGMRITYNVKASKDKWVIISAGGQAMNRIHDRWPLMDGEI